MTTLGQKTLLGPDQFTNTIFHPISTMTKLIRKREHGKFHIFPRLLVSRELTPKATLRSNLESNRRDKMNTTKAPKLKCPPQAKPKQWERQKPANENSGSKYGSASKTIATGETKVNKQRQRFKVQLRKRNHSNKKNKSHQTKTTTQSATLQAKPNQQERQKPTTTQNTVQELRIAATT